MKFKVKHTGNERTRDESLIKLLKSPAIRSVSLKKLLLKFEILSSNANELYVTLNLLAQEKQAGKSSIIIIEEIVAIADKVSEY